MTYEELMEKHQAEREQIMSEEEIKYADRNAQWLVAGWRDKENRGLFDKWEKSDQYWEGDVNLPESDDDPASNTNIVNPHVEGQVNLTVEHSITVVAEPREPSDVDFVEHGEVIGQFILDKNRMRRKIESLSRKRKKFGTGILTVMWNPDMLDGMGCPEFKVWNPAYVFWDPNVTRIDEINNGRFLILICNKSRYWAAQQFGEEKARVIIPGYHPVETEWLFDETLETDEISRDNYVHMFVFTMDKGKVRLVQQSSCGVVLWDSKEHEDIVFPKGKYPVFVAPDMEREGTAYAKATTELLFQTQDLINDLDDQIRINARLCGNIQKVVGTSSGIDIDKWTNESGLNIPAVDPQAWQMVKPPEMPQYILNRRSEALYQERVIQTRFSDQMTGIQQRGVDTATEALSLQQTGLAGIDHDKMIIEDTLAEALEYALELAKENWTEEMAFRITNKKNSFLWYRPSDLKKVPKKIPASQEYIERYRKSKMVNGALPEGYKDPEYMLASGDDGTATKDVTFDIKVSIGAGIPNNRAFRYNVIREAFVAGAIDLPEYRYWLKKLGALPETSYEQEQQINQKLEQLMMMKNMRPQKGGMNADVEGLTQNGTPQSLQNQGGVGGVYPVQQPQS